MVRLSTFAQLKTKAAAAKARVVTKREAQGKTNERSVEETGGEVGKLSYSSRLYSSMKFLWTDREKSPGGRRGKSPSARCVCFPPPSQHTQDALARPVAAMRRAHRRELLLPLASAACPRIRGRG